MKVSKRQGVAIVVVVKVWRGREGIEGGTANAWWGVWFEGGFE